MTTIRAYGYGCMGSLNNDADIMISVKKDDEQIVDYFLDTKQATYLLKELEKRLKINEEDRLDDIDGKKLIERKKNASRIKGIRT